MPEQVLSERVTVVHVLYSELSAHVRRLIHRADADSNNSLHYLQAPKS